MNFIGQYLLKFPDYPQDDMLWNKSQCKKGKEWEYAHFHFKFFHKTTIPSINGTSQEINKQYQQQVEAGNVLVDISQISFLSWHQEQKLARTMNAGFFQQTISIATLNKKAEHLYAKEIKNQRRLDDDPSIFLEHKIHTLNQNYENLIKKDIKSEQLINQDTRQQEVTYKQQLKNNKSPKQQQLNGG